MPRKAKVRPNDPGRERVLEAALELFGARGYHATSIAEIGERAEIAKSVLYHYFDSKAKLYEAVIEAETHALLARVAEALPEDPQAPRLRVGVEAYLAFLAERPASWRLFLRDPTTDPELADVHERLAGKRSAGQAALLARPDKRRVAPEHVELVATAIRTFAAWWYDHREVPRDAVVESILDVAAAGSKRLAGSPK